MTQTKKVLLRIPEHLSDEVDDYAAEALMSRTAAVNMLISEGLHAVAKRKLDRAQGDAR